MADTLVCNYGLHLGNILTLSNGDIWVIGCPGNSATTLYGFVSTNGGASWAAGFSVTASTAFGASTSWGHVQSAVDGNDLIHIVGAATGSGVARSIAYDTYNPSNNSWGTWEGVIGNYGTGVSSSGAYADIAIDSNNKPHVVFVNWASSMGSDWAQIYYSEKTGASWSTPLKLNATAGATHFQPSITLKASNYIEVTYLRYLASAIAYRTYTGSWSSEADITTAASTNTGSAINVDGSGNVYRYSITSGGSAKENNQALFAGVLFQQNGTYGDATFVCDIVSGLWHWLYVKTNGDIVYRTYDRSTLSGETTLAAATTNGRVLGAWCYNHNNNGTVWYYAYTNGNTTYFGNLYGGAAPVTVSLNAASMSATPQGVTAALSGTVYVTPASASALRLRSRIVGKTINVSWARLYQSVNQGLFIVPRKLEMGMATVDPTVILGSTTAIPAAALFALATIDPVLLGLYGGILKRWDGNGWVRALLKVYKDNAWEQAKLMVYLESEWKEVDTSG